MGNIAIVQIKHATVHLILTEQRDDNLSQEIDNIVNKYASKDSSLCGAISN